ncbi:hypothetical protein EDC94DRAFT_235812 [Helicostylum pulchrum]|nr:hypothetical protein EDC94DRAFT_235812 [Helicostylum pulchrum]
MQVIGFECHLLHLVLVKPKHYMLIKIATISYPVTVSQINEGGIEQIINVLTYVKQSNLDMKSQIDRSKTRKHINKIEDILGTTSAAETPQCNSNILWPDLSILDNKSNWDDEEEGEEYKEEVSRNCRRWK